VSRVYKDNESVIFEYYKFDKKQHPTRIKLGTYRVSAYLAYGSGNLREKRILLREKRSNKMLFRIYMTGDWNDSSFSELIDFLKKDEWKYKT
jgi:hypothetical protein